MQDLGHAELGRRRDIPRGKNPLGVLLARFCASDGMPVLHCDMFCQLTDIFPHICNDWFLAVYKHSEDAHMSEALLGASDDEE